jgi:hypothetical protein
MALDTIDDVLVELDLILERAENEGTRDGYFAALYRKVTARVKSGIEAGEFEDGPRMERLDVAFARRYLDAHTAWLQDGAPTASWALALGRTRTWRPIVLQHLLGGINAHINLDLGIAAAEVAGDDLNALRADFEAINGVLAELTGGVKEELGQIWPALPLLDRVVGSVDDRIIEFSMSRARDAAWDFAQQLASAPRDDWPDLIVRRDEEVTRLAQLNYSPGLTLSLTMLLVRVTEHGNPAEIIRILR